jgi:hypothetical protein
MMNALVWRLHRNQAYTAAAALAALTVLLATTGIAMAGSYHSFLASCGATHSCASTSGLFSSYGVVSILVTATMAVPLLFGMFWGAPLLAGEFEDGTHALAWTQGITRRRWLNRNITWALLAAAAWGAAMTALVSWWRGPENALGIGGIRLSPGVFDIQGITPAAYSIFAVALGIAAGAVFRRTLPALVTTFTVFAGLRFLIAEYVRPHYLTPASRLIALGAGAQASGGAPAGAWLLSTTLTGPGGQNYGTAVTSSQMPAVCRGLGLPCLASHGFRTLITYQPASRFWAFQGIEAGIFIALAAALIAVTYQLVLTRDA